ELGLRFDRSVERRFDLAQLLGDDRIVLAELRLELGFDGILEGVERLPLLLEQGFQIVGHGCVPYAVRVAMFRRISAAIRSAVPSSRGSVPGAPASHWSQSLKPETAFAASVRERPFVRRVASISRKSSLVMSRSDFTAATRAFPFA